jgi:hypothetical protein
MRESQFNGLCGLCQTAVSRATFDDDDDDDSSTLVTVAIFVFPAKF